jgi:glutamate-5-semialdehyde dehydrogenase
LVLESKLKKIRSGAKALRLSSAEKRNKVLKDAAIAILQNQKKILAANTKDLNALDGNAAPAFRDRLTLNEVRLNQMAASLNQLAELPDPLASSSKQKTLKNGLKLRKVHSPLGVIFMIFESRPNVAVEAFSMGFKAGNTMILRGGKESQHTTNVLYSLLASALKKNKFSEHILWGISNPDRTIVSKLLRQKNYIDVVVPRGGDGLIHFVVENSLIPIIKNDRGLCHTYVHFDADIEMAAKILVNAKTQRPGVCNSMETILVHSKAAVKLLPLVYNLMSPFKVKWFVCPKTKKILNKLSNVGIATDKNYATEYLDQIVNCRIVESFEEATEHIEKFGSRHSEAIITASKMTAARFQKEVDAAVVYHNASTRFTDGFEFGLGGELGISTQKLHVRGPVGLQALTNERWVVDGNGQIRD